MSRDTTVLNQPILRVLLLLVAMLGGCAHRPSDLPATEVTDSDYVYTIAPGDRLDIFVWRNEEVSVSNIPVMPDGRISTPLVEQMMASGKT